MVNCVIDTSIFQKLFGYYKNKTNNDQQYNVEKLYNDILKKNKKIIVPIFCFYEILNKPMELNQKMEVLKFFTKLNVYIGLLNKGKIELKSISNQDLEDLDLQKTIEYNLKKKQELEIFEVQEYVKYTLFLIKYLIIDILLVEDKNIDIIQYVLTIYDKYKAKLYLQVDEEIKKSFEKGYSSNRIKVVVKNKVFEIYKNFICELYAHMGNIFPNIKCICDKEILCINKMTTSLDYIRKKIYSLQKHYNIKKYTSKINKLYYAELKKLHYPNDFRNYFIFILDKQIYEAKFDKNDSIDSLIYFFKKPNNYILSSDNTINSYLSKKHKNNFNYVKQFRIDNIFNAKNSIEND